MCFILKSTNGSEFFWRRAWRRENKAASEQRLRRVEADHGTEHRRRGKHSVHFTFLASNYDRWLLLTITTYKPGGEPRHGATMVAAFPASRRSGGVFACNSGATLAPWRGKVQSKFAALCVDIPRCPTSGLGPPQDRAPAEPRSSSPVSLLVGGSRCEESCGACCTSFRHLLRDVIVLVVFLN